MSGLNHNDLLAKGLQQNISLAKEKLIKRNENARPDENDLINSKIDRESSTCLSAQAPSLTSKPISIETDVEYYDTTNANIGVALIFNHLYINGQQPRDGSDVDCDRLSRVLRSLQFDVRVYTDLSYDAIKRVLKETAAEDHSQNDCLIVTVLTHGEEGILYAKDKSYNVKELWNNFAGDNCETLIGKPKIFFVQASRGDKLDCGVELRSNPYDCVDSINVSGEEEEPVTYFIPQMADLLIMYSTFEGYQTWRNPETGSWFIQSLCDEFVKHGRNRDLLSILTGVNRRVAFTYQSNVPKDYEADCRKQIPCITSMLTKFFFFLPKK